MAVDMLYFAWVREQIGISSERIDPPGDVTNVSALIDWLAQSSTGHASAFADKARLRAAVDHQFVSLDATIAHAREIAIFPPVTGG